MPDSRLYALIEHLRANGVDVVPGLWFDEHGWHEANARAAIVVWCQNDVLSRRGDNPNFRKVTVHHTDPLGWVLAVYLDRGVEVPEEMKGAIDEG